MADFSTEAELSIVVPQRELRSARQEVEDALADIPVGMSASGGGGGGATNNSREQRRRRREFRWARQRTDDMEMQVELLESIDSSLDEGGLGGDGMMGMVGDLIGVGGDAAGIAAEGAGLLAEGAATAAGTAVGSAAGDQISQAVSEDTVSIESATKPEWLPLTVEEPEWAPIEVDAPSDDGGFFDDLPSLPVPEVDDLPSLPMPDVDSLPSLPLPDFLSGGPDPLPIEEPPMLEVKKPEWVPIQVDRPEPRGGTGGGRGRRGVRQQDAFNRGIRKVPFIGDILGDADRSLRPSAGGELAFPLPGQSATPGNDPSGARASPSASTGDVNVTVNADVQSAVQETVDDLRREQERQREELRRDLEQQINDLERTLSNVGGGGGI